MRFGLNNRHKAAVSLFVVIFATLLITVVTVSFARLMIKGQQQVTVTDLSQSAYDSAMAGVEDAKRALLKYRSICDSGDSVACDTAKAVIASDTCNIAVKSLSDITVNNEVDIKTNDNDTQLDQAYTCVKITLNTVDYLGHLSKNEFNLIPLIGVEDFDKITIEWFNEIDSNTVTLNSESSMPLTDNWDLTTPPILRAQLMQFGNDFQLTDFNQTTGNTNTLFLYPTSNNTGRSTTRFSLDSHTNPSNSPVLIKCSAEFEPNGYACSATITIENTTGDTMISKFLLLGSIYNQTNYRITMINDAGDEVNFDGVQPEVDSTGRTNDMFRRVKSRVEMNLDFPYPEAAVDMTSNFCKDFFVTNDAGDYDNRCTP